jgi:hypothetical protein
VERVSNFNYLRNLISGEEKGTAIKLQRYNEINEKKKNILKIL